jgi:MauM/NapG family ferredoxin protein
MLRRVRILTQALIFCLFCFLFIQTESKGHDELGYPVKVFLDLDPLVFLSTILSSHFVEGALYLSILTLLVTVLAGRFFCGWFCPMGSLNNAISIFNKRQRPPKNWHRLKYYLLIFLLVGSLLGLQVTGVFDPISLMIRSFSIGLYPVLNQGLNSVLNTLYNTNLPPLMALSDLLGQALKKTVLAFNQPHYLQSGLIFLLFAFILGLNLVERRFWCRYLCPLGALLGLISRYSLVGRHVSEGCTSCGKCERACPAAAAPQRDDSYKKVECYYCFNCDDLCPSKAVSFTFKTTTRAVPIDLERRWIYISAVSAVVAAVLSKTSPRYREAIFNPSLIRPPGALKETDFLGRCVKCGECMKVCITNGLQPTLFEAGLEGIWTPMLVPKIGYCEYRCTLCGQVCPTGAIRRLTLKEKAEIKIGLAMIDKGRCIPYAHGKSCIVCEEVCPTPKKAIWFNQVELKDRDGKRSMVLQPVVDTELCIGCGICETKCPVVDRPAIYVTSIGESRSKENQLLL